MQAIPSHWPKRYNGSCNIPCDALDGPCSCSGWHSILEEWVQENIRKYGWAEQEARQESVIDPIDKKLSDARDNIFRKIFGN